MHNKVKAKQKWFWGAVIVIELILFYSSSMTYKEQTSVPFLERVLGTSNKPFYNTLSKISFNYGGKTQSIENDGYFHFIEFFIRKGAHFGIYFLLGLFLCLAVYKYFSKNRFLMMLIPWLATTGLAAFDEFHQGLTGGRTPSVTDVILDSVGALTGILILMLILWIIEVHHKKDEL